MELPGSGQPIVMRGSGVEDAAKRRAQITMNVPRVGEIEAVTDGLLLYMRSDLFRSVLGGKEWMKLDVERTNESLGIDSPAMQPGQSGAEQLRMLEKVSTGVTEEGREEVVGVQATHYSATIDLRDYPGQKFDKLIELTGQTEIPIDVWIDDEQRVRRMEWEQEFRRGRVEVGAKAIVEYKRFGVPVDIEIPDDDDVFDATEMAVQGLN